MSYLVCDVCGLSVRVRAVVHDLDRCPRCGSAAVLLAAPDPHSRRRSAVTPVRSTVRLRGTDPVSAPPRMDPA